MKKRETTKAKMGSIWKQNPFVKRARRAKENLSATKETVKALRSSFQSMRMIVQILLIKIESQRMRSQTCIIF